jgi:hypothetical protein
MIYLIDNLSRNLLRFVRKWRYIRELIYAFLIKLEIGHLLLFLDIIGGLLEKLLLNRLHLLYFDQVTLLNSLDAWLYLSHRLLIE